MDATRFDRISRMLAERKLSRRTALWAGGSGVAASVGSRLFGEASAQQATPAAEGVGPNGEEVDLLFVQTFGGGELRPKGGDANAYTLTLSEAVGSTLYFSDRPERFVGTIPTQRFLDQLGFTPDNPPNAALVVEQPSAAAMATPTSDDGALGDTEDIYVVELTNPTYDAAASQLTYDVHVLADTDSSMTFREAPGTGPESGMNFGAAHLFIDDFLCGTHDIVCCYNGEAVADLGSHCFHWSVDDGGCEPCASGHYESYTETCNSDYADVCPNGGCFANREGCS